MNEFERELADAQRRRRRRVRTATIGALAVTVAAGAVGLFKAWVQRLDVAISPPEAAATAVVNVIDGYGVAGTTWIWALHGPLTLRVGADGFVTETLDVAASSETRRRVDVVLSERLAMLRATTDVNEARTRWFLDGTFVMEGARLDTELRDGEHVLEARHPYHAPASRTVTARRGAVYDVTLALASVEGRMTLTSDPTAAAVTRNGEPEGRTPLELDVSGGAHALRIALDGYETRTETVPITHTTPTVTRHFRLARARAGVSFTLSPENGVLSVDGRVVSDPENLRLDAGVAHRVRYRSRGYAPLETTVTLQPDEHRAIELALSPDVGVVNVESEPEADVAVNGASVGRTPMRLTLPPTPHTIRLTRDGYRTVTRTLTPDPDVEQRLSVMLTADVQDRPVTPPPATERASAVAPSPAEERADPVTPSEVAERARPVTPPPATERASAVAPSPAEERADPVTPSEVAERARPVTPPPATERARAVAPSPAEKRADPVTPSEVAERVRPVTPPPATERTPPAVPPQYTNDAGIALKLFRNPGAVMLGTTRGEPGRRANEFLREVRLARAFYAAVHEVTVGQYRRFAHPDQPPAADRRPVTGIAWEDAARFCNWLSRQETLAPVYQFTGGRHVGSRADANGYRLPTEAEWEWLARKAGRSVQTRFPWGDATSVPAGSGNLADESSKGTVPVYIPRYNDGFAGMTAVGTFTANASGLHDLAGNVSEWTHDIYTLQPPPDGRVETDPFETESGAWHTVKGSSWRSGDLGELRAAYRTGSQRPKPDLGFRIVRYLDGGS